MVFNMMVYSLILGGSFEGDGIAKEKALYRDVGPLRRSTSQARTERTLRGRGMEG
jgi:hypothetical protein